MKMVGKVNVTGLLSTGRKQIKTILWIIIKVKFFKHSNQCNVKIIVTYYFSLFSIPTALSIVFFFTPD